jgi:hypothetical protein
MSRNWNRDNPVADAEEHFSREIPSRGRCVICKRPIPTWDQYYQIENELVCEECIYDWLEQFRKCP